MDENLTSLSEKQVVNLCDGRMLGHIIDFKLNICSGNLSAIILPGETGFFGFKKCTDIIIPWEKICRIGEDAIIVDIGVLPACTDENDFKKKKKKW